MTNRMFTHTRAIMATLLAATLLLAGCVTERGDEPCADGNAVFVSFSVVTPKPVPSAGGSRAGEPTWGDDYKSESDKGNAFDNAINNSQLRVYITNTNCSEIKATVSNFLMGGKTETDDGIQYDYVGIISSDQISALQRLEGTGKLHVVANAGADVKLSDNPTFTFSGKPGNGFSAIPMWGVRGDIDFSGIKGGERIDAGTVYLLRAMAKVEIIIDPDDSNSNSITKINSVTLNRYNSGGYLLPTDWTSYGNTKEIEREAIHPLDDTLQNPLTITGADTDGKYTFYLPECRNGSGDDAIKMTLNYSTVMDIDLKDDIYFCKYDTNGQPQKEESFNICRNHFYRFIVRRNATEITVTAEVVPYHEVILNPGFGLDVPKKDKDPKPEESTGTGN